MRTEEVVNRLALLTDAPPEDRQRLYFICKEACDYIENFRSKSGEADDSEAERLETAAVYYALYRKTAIEALGGDGFESFKAGDLEIKTSDGRLENARRLWNEQRELVSDLLNDGGEAFYFMRTEGGRCRKSR